MTTKRVKQKVAKKKEFFLQLKESVSEVSPLKVSIKTKKGTKNKQKATVSGTKYISAGILFKEHVPKCISETVTPVELVAGSVAELLESEHFNKYKSSPNFQEFRLVNHSEGLYMLVASINNTNLAIGYVAQLITQ